MPDSFTDRLDHLAPSVDMTASRAVFDRAVGQSSRRSRLLPAAVVTLLIAGVVGLWALGRSSTVEAPVAPPDGTTEPTRRDGPVMAGAGFDVVHVAQTETEFGLASLVTSGDQFQDWMNPAPEVAAVDFGRNVALVMTRPDNACPDELTQFNVATPDNGTPVWTPQFEELASACDDPLLSWLYVVTLDRAALGRAATIRIPADETYGTSEQLLEYRATGDAVPSTDSEQSPTLEPTGIFVPVPDADRPTLHNTSVGLLWVVRHDNDSISVLPATIDAPIDEDAGGVTGLQDAVAASDVGDGFTAAGFTWDGYGRALNGGRANDLAGYAGRIVGDEIEVLLSDATRISGTATPAPQGFEASFDLSLAGLGRPIDPGTFLTLSTTGPIWRYLDAALVVENGVGRICQVDGSVPVDRLTTCAPDQIVLDTQVTAGDPTITSWFFSPILAFQDPLQGFTSIIPLGGSASRAETETAGQSNVTVLGTELACRESVGLIIRVDFELASPGAAEFVVMDGDVELGSAGASAGTDGPVGVGFALSAAPSPQARLLVSTGDSEQTIPLTDLGELDCASTTRFTVVAVEDRVQMSVGEIASAGSEADYIALWDDLTPEFDRPTSIDFSESVALIVTIPGDACADELDHFERTDDNWLIPIFRIPDSETGCVEPMWPWTFVVAVDRASLGTETAGFRLPADPTYGYPTVEAPLPPTST